MEIHVEVSAVLATRQATMLAALADFVDAVEPQLVTPLSRAALRALDVELENITAALNMTLGDDANLPVHDAERLYLRAGSYLGRRGLWPEKVNWGMALLERKGRASVALLNNLGVAYDDLGQHDTAAGLYRLCIEARGSKEDDPALARAYSNLATACWKLGQLDEALDYAQRGLALERQQGDLHAAATSLMNIASIKYEQWQMAESLELTHEALDIVTELGDVYLQAQFTSTLATHLVGNLLFDEAVPVYEEALRLLTELDDAVGLARAQFNFALLCRLLKQTDQARQLAIASLALYERFQLTAEAAKARNLLAQLNG